ncbi:MAG: hypothetical protein JWM91_2596 [Rhodospirillales bacterium]|nr:hypothetical protein [Rhodospirillales bacterium]
MLLAAMHVDEVVLDGRRAEFGINVSDARPRSLRTLGRRVVTLQSRAIEPLLFEARLMPKAQIRRR